MTTPSPEDRPVSDPPVHGWTLVELGTVIVQRIVEWEPGVLVQGYRTDPVGRTEVLVLVENDGTFQVFDAPIAGPTRSLAGYNGSTMVAIGESPPSLLSWPSNGRRRDETLLGNGFARWELPYTTEGAVRVWATKGEDQFFISEWPDGRLTAAEPHMGDLYPEGGGLIRAPGSGDLIVGSGQGFAYVFGAVGPPGEPARQSLWRVNGEGMDESSWLEVQLDPPLDAVTSFDEVFDVHIAVHTGLRPLVFNDRRQRLEAPDVDLDPDHPQVLVLYSGDYWTVELGGDDAAVVVPGLTLVVQSRESGAQMWVRASEGWVATELPAGRLDAAHVHGYGTGLADQLWVVLEGQLWRPKTTPAA